MKVNQVYSVIQYTDISRQALGGCVKLLGNCAYVKMSVTSGLEFQLTIIERSSKSMYFLYCLIIAVCNFSTFSAHTFQSIIDTTIVSLHISWLYQHFSVDWTTCMCSKHLNMLQIKLKTAQNMVKVYIFNYISCLCLESLWLLSLLLNFAATKLAVEFYRHKVSSVKLRVKLYFLVSVAFADKLGRD